MSLRSLLIIKPINSKIYLRLVLGLNLITAVLILHSTISLYIQLFLLLFLGGYYFYTFSKSPCSDILELRLTGKQCILLLKNGQMLYYEQIRIPIHNRVFQLVKLRDPAAGKNRFLVLFNDQLPEMQLRLLHINVRMMEFK